MINWSSQRFYNQFLFSIYELQLSHLHKYYYYCKYSTYSIPDWISFGFFVTSSKNRNVHIIYNMSWLLWLTSAVVCTFVVDDAFMFTRVTRWPVYNITIVNRLKPMNLISHQNFSDITIFQWFLFTICSLFILETMN